MADRCSLLFSFSTCAILACIHGFSHDMIGIPKKQRRKQFSSLPKRGPDRYYPSQKCLLTKTDGADGSVVVDEAGGVLLECAAVDDKFLTNNLKRELFQLGASYGRGFGASPSGRARVLAVIEDLEERNLEDNAARGIEGGGGGEDEDPLVAPSSSSSSLSPLTGNWRLIWTTAADVLLLDANPFLATGPIYQVFEPPVVTNVIDLQPRVQSLVPPDMIRNCLGRAKVQTRASARSDYPNRVVLDFKSVKLEPLQFFGMNIDVFPPIGFDLPRISEVFFGDNPDSNPGFFDVTYLDEDLLIIRQNSPGGIFVSVKVDSIEP